MATSKKQLVIILHAASFMYIKNIINIKLIEIHPMNIIFQFNLEDSSELLFVCVLISKPRSLSLILRPFQV